MGTFAKEWEARSAPKEVVEGQIYNEKAIGGGRGTNDKLAQFLKNDLRVLRFYCYWDDRTLYGVRQYYILSYFLSENQVQIADVHQRNSGRDPYPVFYKKNPLPKKPTINITPGMLEPHKDYYMPQDLKCGGEVSVYGRKLFLYECDPFTRVFYREWLDYEQKAISIPEPPTYAVEMPIPPHVGVGTDEDTLGSCFALWPKPPKQDLMKLMTMSGQVLRFEAEIAVPVYPEDADRKFLIGYSLGDDTVMVYELKRRNSGFMEGAFSEKSKKKNPKTGKFWCPDDLYVGNTMTIAAMTFRLIRPDEYTLAHMEARPLQFPFSDPVKVVSKLRSYLESNGLPTSGVDYTPQQLQSYGCLVDQEIITLLRKHATEDSVVLKADDVFA